MTVARLLTILLLAAAAGCGGTLDITCDEQEFYELAQEGKRIEVPEGLDSLDEFKEIPLPKASPREERPEGSPCLDRPPTILGQE